MVDYGKMVTGSFAYAKDGLVGKWMNWLLLIVSCIIFPLILGYFLRVCRNEVPAPELKDWGGMFIDGIKLFIVMLIYMIPVYVIGFVAVGSAALTAVMNVTNPAADAQAMMNLIGVALFGIVILAAVIVVIYIIVATAYVRFARTNSMMEAFNFGEIFAQITKIGVVPYIAALVIFAVIMGIVIGILMALNMVIPLIGTLILLIIMPLLVLFQARYYCLLYDSAGTA